MAYRDTPERMPCANILASTGARMHLRILKGQYPEILILYSLDRSPPNALVRTCPRKELLSSKVNYVHVFYIVKFSWNFSRYFPFGTQRRHRLC